MVPRIVMGQRQMCWLKAFEREKSLIATMSSAFLSAEELFRKNNVGSSLSRDLIANPGDITVILCY